MRTEPAPAKLNLALHVRARRDDGYHELETLFAFVEHGDILTLAPAPDSRLTLAGGFAGQMAEAPGPNLIDKAVASFREAFGGAHYAITLDKRIPIAAGLGGGSADAAAALRSLAAEQGVALDDPKLIACADRLGSDVPACLLGKTAIGRGRGERLTPVEGLGETPVLLVNPGVAVSTAQVFSGWDCVDRGPMGDGGALEIALNGRNDLEAPALAIAPVIGEVLRLLAGQPGVKLARMSGSGATCFALFDDERASNAAAEVIRAAQPDWWVQPTRLA